MCAGVYVYPPPFLEKVEHYTHYQYILETTSLEDNSFIQMHRTLFTDTA